MAGIKSPVDRLPHRKALAVFMCVVAVLPLVLPGKYYISILVLAGIFSMLALGLNLVMGYTGQVSLGHAGFYGLGAYASGVLTTKYGFNPWLAMIAALFVCAIASGLIGAAALRLQGYYLSMATLGFGIILYILFVELAWLTGGPSGLTGIPEFRIGTFKINSDVPYYYLVWTIVGALLLFAFHLVDSRVGRSLRAIQGDETAAALVGVNTWGTKVQIFVVGACMASLAGSLYAHYVTVLTPETFGFMLSIEIVVMVIVGGSGSIWGGLLGAILLTLLPEYLRVMKDYDVLIYGAIVILVVMFLPRGIGGGIEHWLRQRMLAKRSGEMAETLLKVRDLRKAFGGLKAVDGVSFGVPRGCIKAIIGPNGAGKTTLINLITGLERLNSGEVHFAGQRIDTRQPYEIVRLGIARTFQNLKLFADMSVLENVMAGRHSRTHVGLLGAVLRSGRSRAEETAIEADATRLLGDVGLLAHSHERAGDLPFGKQRLLEIARALATEPRLLLLDEPAAGLNSAEAAGLGSFIRRIRDSGVTVLLVEHHMELIMDISDEIFVLNFGQYLAQGTPAEVKNNPAVIAAYLGDESSLAEDFRA